MIESRLNKGVKSVSLDEETPEDLVGCTLSLPINDYVICPNCHKVVPYIEEDEYEITDKWTYDDGYDTDDEYGEYTGNKEFTCSNCGKHYVWSEKRPLKTIWTDDLQDIPNIDEIVPGYMEVFNSVYEIYEKNNEDDWGKAFDIYMKQKKGDDNVEVKTENKMNLQEATIKALYDGLKDDTEVNDVEGLVDDVLVVTDPEITTDEYNEVIERAEEIVEETPEGDIPLDPSYLGEYLQLCPICGGSFVEDHILEPGTACPICYETPEAFVMIGKLQAEDEVAEDNGLVDDTNVDINVNPINTEPELDNTTETNEDESTNNEKDTEPTGPEEPTEQPTRVRGARVRQAASKEVPIGNILVETRVNQALLKNRKTNKSYTYKELQDMYQNSKENDDYTFEQYIDDLIKSGEYMDLTETKLVDKTNNTKKQEDYERYKVSFYVDSTETPKDEIKNRLNAALKNTGLASGKEDIEIEIDEIIEENIDDNNSNKELLLGDEQSDSAEYTVELVFEDKIKELANDSAFTWEGMRYTKDSLQQIVEDLKANTDITLPVHFYIFDGRTMNRLYGLTQENAYPDNLKFVSIDLDNWSSLNRLPKYKQEVKARWLDDIVSNNDKKQEIVNDDNK